MALEFLDVGRIERHARTFLAAALIDENQIAIFDKAAQGSQRHLQSICSLPRSEQLYVAAIHASVPDKAYRRFVNCETPLSSNDPRDGASPSRQASRRGSPRKRTRLQGIEVLSLTFDHRSFCFPEMTTIERNGTLAANRVP